MDRLRKQRMTHLIANYLALFDVKEGWDQETTFVVRVHFEVDIA